MVTVKLLCREAQERFREGLTCRKKISQKTYRRIAFEATIAIIAAMPRPRIPRLMAGTRRQEMLLKLTEHMA